MGISLGSDELVAGMIKDIVAFVVRKNQRPEKFGRTLSTRLDLFKVLHQMRAHFIPEFFRATILQHVQQYAM